MKIRNFVYFYAEGSRREKEVVNSVLPCLFRRLTY
jgi:hypothetical protein